MTYKIGMQLLNKIQIFPNQNKSVAVATIRDQGNRKEFQLNDSHPSDKEEENVSPDTKTEEKKEERKRFIEIKDSARLISVTKREEGREGQNKAQLVDNLWSFIESIADLDEENTVKVGRKRRLKGEERYSKGYDGQQQVIVTSIHKGLSTLD